MELSEQHLKTLEDEGFTDVYEWSDTRGTHYDAHTHEYKTAILVSEGSMDVSIDNETKTLNAGNRIDIPAYVLHAVHIGSDGCKYVVGEMN
jgi:quercetin dioxygenase-like cupin family protein